MKECPSLYLSSWVIFVLWLRIWYNTMLSSGKTAICGQDGHMTPAVLGVPTGKRGDKIRSGYLTVSGAHAILGTEKKCTICEGERPKKENVAIK